MFLVPVAIAVAAVALVVVIGRSRGAPLAAILLGLLVAAAVWVGAVALESTGWHDTDGWVDCYGYCNRWHLLGAVLFWAPLLTGLLLVLALAAEIFARLRRRRSGP